MADETPASGSSTAVLDRPEEEETPRPQDDAGMADNRQKSKDKKKKRKDEDEYELELETPFGKLEFEFEPKSAKQRKDREKKEKAERAAATNAARAEKKAQKQGFASAAEMAATPRRGSNLLPILLIFGLIVAAAAIAVWLFARPGEDEDQVPQEFLNEDAVPVAEPQGFVAKARRRIGHAVRAGRQASREAQREQEAKFQDLTSQ